MSTAYGLIRNESSAKYHATEGVSSHRLADFSAPNLPLLYYRRHISKEAAKENIQSEAMSFGEAFHCLTLEGESAFAERFCVSPSFDRRTKQGKADAEAFASKNAGKSVISEEDLDLAWKMTKAIRAKPVAARLFEKGTPEIVARVKMASFDIQSRLDWFDDTLDKYGRPLIVDVKTIDHLSNFNRQFLKFNYWKQAAFYRIVTQEAANLGGPFPRFLFVVIEKEEPHQVEVREPDEITLDVARRHIMSDLARLKQCYDSGVWPGSSDEITPISVPDYIQEMPIP